MHQQRVLSLEAIVTRSTPVKLPSGGGSHSPRGVEATVTRTGGIGSVVDVPQVKTPALEAVVNQVVVTEPVATVVGLFVLELDDIGLNTV